MSLKIRHWIFSLSLVMICAGCVDDLQPLARARAERSFGEHFFTLTCQRLAYQSSLDQQGPGPVDVSGSLFRQACRHGAEHLPAWATELAPKVATLVHHRQTMVDSMDRIFPEEELSVLQELLLELLPLTDDGTLPALIQRTEEALQLLAEDEGFSWSLARLDGRVGYRPRAAHIGVIREVLQFPHLQELLSKSMALIGEGGAGHQSFLDLMAALSFELQTYTRVDDSSRADPIHPSDDARPLRLALDLLLKHEEGLSSPAPFPTMLVRRDWRGLAQVQRGHSSALPSPFVDENEDGDADVNPLGKFVTLGDRPPPQPFLLEQDAPDWAASRDGMGRALNELGTPLYEYFDLDSSLLGALMRDTLSLMNHDREMGFQLLKGAMSLLGDRRSQTRVAAGGESIEYLGFDSSRAPLLDLLHALLQALQDPHIDELFETLQILARHHEPLVARVVDASLAARELARLRPEAQLPRDSTMVDDLFPVLQSMARVPGLLGDIVGALGDPRTGKLGIMLFNYLTYKNTHYLNPVSMQLDQAWFTEPVDRSLPDSGTNRSIFQRFLHIIHDTNGMKLCNKEGAMIDLAGTPLAGPFKACELYEVDNAAIFYTQSMARLRDTQGTLTSTPKGLFRLKTENLPFLLQQVVGAVGLDAMLGTLTGIPGMSSHPTTEALNRLLFLDPQPPSLTAIQGPIMDIDGHDVARVHAGSLLGLEVPHPQFACTSEDPCLFLDAVGPLMQAFADHDAEHLFLDLVSVLHRHWASRDNAQHQFQDPQGSDYATGTGAVVLEHLLADLFSSSDLLPALSSLAAQLERIQLGGGSGADALVRSLGFFLNASNSTELSYRHGGTTTMTSDGTRVVPGGVSVFYLLADALKGAADALDRFAAGPDKDLGAAWNSAGEHLIATFFRVNKGGEAWRFENPRMIPGALILLDFLRSRLIDHRQVGDLTWWLGSELPRIIEDLVTGPLIARAMDFSRVLSADPQVHEALLQLWTYLLSELEHPQAFRTTLTAVADTLQLLLDEDDLVPVAHALGRTLDPERGLTLAALRFLGGAIAKDRQGIVPLVLRHAFSEQRPGVTPLQLLLNLATEVHRLEPGQGGPYMGEDFSAVLSQIGDFLGNQETGLANLLSIISNRCAGPCAASAAP